VSLSIVIVYIDTFKLNFGSAIRLNI